MMKRTLLLGLLLTSVSAFAFMGGPRDDMRMLFESLDLSASQKTQLRTIRNEARDERRALMDKLEALRDKTDERVLAVLTDEQKKLYKSKRAEMMQKRKEDRMINAKMRMQNPRCD